MIEEKTLNSAEQTLRKAQELMGKIREQNERWPGAGAFDKDITEARMLLQEMEKILANIIVAFSQHLDEPTNSGLEVELSQAFHKAYSLMSRLYDDASSVYDALSTGRSQSNAIKQIEAHLQQLIRHCKKTRDHLRDTARIVN